MSVTLSGVFIAMSATGDVITFPPGMPRKVVSMTFQGTGLTAGQRIVVRDSGVAGSGNILSDYQVEATTDNADLWNARQSQLARGLAIDAGTVAGTWVLTTTFEP